MRISDWSSYVCSSDLPEILEETVKFVENFRMTETLFEAAEDARRRGSQELADDIGKMLLSWTFKAGEYQTVSAILDRSVYGLAKLAIPAYDAASFTGRQPEITPSVHPESLPDQQVQTP